MQFLFCVCAVLTSFLDRSSSPLIFEEEEEEDPLGIDEFMQEQLKLLKDKSASVIKHGEDGFRYNIRMCPAYVLFRFRSCLVMMGCAIVLCASVC